MFATKMTCGLIAGWQREWRAVPHQQEEERSSIWSSHEAGIRITIHSPSFFSWFQDHGSPSLYKFLCVSCACSYPQDWLSSNLGAIVFTPHSHLSSVISSLLWWSIAGVWAHQAHVVTFPTGVGSWFSFLLQQLQLNCWDMSLSFYANSLGVILVVGLWSEKRKCKYSSSLFEVDVVFHQFSIWVTTVEYCGSW